MQLFAADVQFNAVPAPVTTKGPRQESILRIVRRQGISTLGALRAALHEEGFDVDQATLSRDIKELGLVKAPTAQGYRYAPVDAVTPVIPARSTGVLSRFARGAELAGQIIVVRTDPGSASTVAEALDHIQLREVVGTLAGDNTIFVACRSAAAARRALARLNALREGHS